MKPKNFPARKLLRQLNANERKRVHGNEKAIPRNDPQVERTLTAYDELSQLEKARNIRTKKFRGAA